MPLPSKGEMQFTCSDVLGIFYQMLKEEAVTSYIMKERYMTRFG